MIKSLGFTIVEILVFIVITGLLMSTLFLGSSQALRASPNIHNQWVALQIARGCMEWFVGQRRVKGYNQYTCGSSPSTSLCPTRTGFTVSASVTCPTWNGDTYKMITVSVSGLSSVSLATQFGNY